MGFFESLPPPRPRCVHPPLPPWIFPPANVIGTFVPTRAVFVRSESLLVLADRFVAYPNGVDFSVVIQRNKRVPGEFRFPDRWRWHNPADRSDDLAVGVVFSDGARASSLVGPTLGEQVQAPVVSTYRAGGGHGGWEQRCWLWPLPPDGPLHIAVRWTAAHLAETWGEVDGGAIASAGRGASVLWDE